MGSKLIVVACNTATTNAISTLREKFNIPIIGIEPAIKPAALNTQSKSIGVLATKGTLSSQLFSSTSKEFTEGIQLIEVIGEGLVRLIEEGKLNSPEMNTLLKKYVDILLNENIDYLVLGCTHYPFLIPQLKKIIPPYIKIIDSGVAIAKQTYALIEKNKQLNTSNKNPSFQFYNNKNTETMAMLLEASKEKIEINYLSF